MGLFRGIGARKDATRGTSPIEVRKVLAGLFASTGGIGARSGILYNGSTAPLGTGDATWAYNVGLFHAYVSRSASDGGTVFGNDGSVLIGATGVGSTVPIAPGAGLSRIDIAWTRHPTAGENGDGATTVALASEPLFGVVSGVAASSNPVAPTALIPAGGFELFRNLMTSAATSTLSAGNTITQSALYTAVRGAPVPCRNQAERDALPLFDGQKADRLDTHVVERYDGTGWALPASVVTFATGEANGVGTGTLVIPSVTFPAVSHNTRVFVQVTSQAGFCSIAVDVGLDIGGSNAVTQPTLALVSALVGKWVTVFRSGYMDIPAGSASGAINVAANCNQVGVYYKASATFTRVNN